MRSITLTCHAGEVASGFDESVAGALITVSIHGYQRDWSFYLPRDLVEARIAAYAGGWQLDLAGNLGTFDVELGDQASGSDDEPKKPRKALK